MLRTPRRGGYVGERFTLYGSPHSLPTYKVALMLRLSDEPFSFRYVSFQKGMHKTSEFLALSRWGQVPVLVDSGRPTPNRRPSLNIWPRRWVGFRGSRSGHAPGRTGMVVLGR